MINFVATLSFRSLWCCSYLTHSMPFVTFWWLLLTTWSRCVLVSSSPIWTGISCMPLSSSEWTTVQLDLADTSVNDWFYTLLCSVQSTMLHMRSCTLKIPTQHAYRLYWDCFVHEEQTKATAPWMWEMCIFTFFSLFISPNWNVNAYWTEINSLLFF